VALMRAVRRDLNVKLLTRYIEMGDSNGYSFCA